MSGGSDTPSRLDSAMRPNAGIEPPRTQRCQRQVSRMKATLFAVGCMALLGAATLKALFWHIGDFYPFATTPRLFLSVYGSITWIRYAQPLLTLPF